MAFVGSTIPAAELSALADDAPLFLGANVLDTATQVKWTSGGLEADADITDTLQPVSAVRDRFLHKATTRTAGNAATHYFNFSLLVTCSFDMIFLRLGSANLINSISFQTAAGGTFAGATTHKTWTGLGTLTAAGGRFVGLSLSTNQRYTGDGYGRLVFTMNASSAAPSIYELWIGQRRQMSRRPDQGSGYDDRPIGMSRDRNQIRGGIVTGLTRARGFQNFRGSFTPTGSDQYNLDDLAALRAYATTDTDYLRDPTVVWIDRPTTAPANAIVGELDTGDSGLALPFQGWALRKMDYALTEVPPFALREPGFS